MSISVTSPSIPSGFTNVKGYATGMLRLSFFTAVVLLTGVEGWLEKGVRGPCTTTTSSRNALIGVEPLVVTVQNSAVIFFNTSSDPIF